MHIDVHTTGDFDRQVRAYAEFRLFATLARFTGDVDTARITLQRHDPDLQHIACEIELTFASGARARVAARSRRVSGAIDRASERAGALLQRRLARFASKQPVAI